MWFHFKWKCVVLSFFLSYIINYSESTKLLWCILKINLKMHIKTRRQFSHAQLTPPPPQAVIASPRSWPAPRSAAGTVCRLMIPSSLLFLDSCLLLRLRLRAWEFFFGSSTSGKFRTRAIYPVTFLFFL